MEEYNPLSPRHMVALAKSMEHSRRKLAPFRRMRLDAIKQFVGKHYSDDGAEDKVPVNMLELAVSVFVRQLAARRPQVMVNTNNRRLKPKAESFGLAINHLLDEIDFETTIRRIVVDAIFSVGIARVGLYKMGDVEIDGFLKDVGQPYCDPILLDDFVIDMAASRWDKATYIGNRYTVPYDLLMQSNWLDDDAKQRLHVDSITSLDDYGGEHVESISRGADGDPDPFMDQCTLWDVWIPPANIMVTFQASGNGAGEPIDTEPLKVADWDGPECGPYHMLGFTTVPGQIMPSAPIQQLMDLHDLGNRLFRKLGRQAERQKTILGVQSAKSDDGERIVNASDGQTIIVDDPASAREYRFGGVDNNGLAFATIVRDWFSYFAGNLDALGGLSPQAGTLGQERLIEQSSSKKIADMQDATVSFTSKIIDSLGWYLWTDPLIEIPIVKRVPGTSVEVPSSYTPEDQEGDFLEYNIRIEPYSMQHRSPGERLATLSQVYQQFILPLLPQLEAMGAYVNWESLIKTIAKYTDMVELDDIIQFQDDGMEQQDVRNEIEGSRKERTQPQVSHRVNERVSRSGTTRAGNDANTVQALLSAGRSQGSGVSVPGGSQ